MKKLMMPALVVLVISSSACAQKLDASKVPAVVKQSFSKQYAGATAKWELEDGHYEAGFKHNGTEMSVLYDANGNMKESEVEIKVAELPANVLTYINAHYAVKKIKEAAKITDAKGIVKYEAEVGGNDLIFDANGNFLESVKG